MSLSKSTQIVRRIVKTKALRYPNCLVGLIGLRAACARVAHMSGAAEKDEEIHRDEEVTEVMAKNGSTAELLISLLNARCISVGA